MCGMMHLIYMCTQVSVSVSVCQRDISTQPERSCVYMCGVMHLIFMCVGDASWDRETETETETARDSEREIMRTQVSVLCVCFCVSNRQIDREREIMCTHVCGMTHFIRMCAGDGSWKRQRRTGRDRERQRDSERERLCVIRCLVRQSCTHTHTCIYSTVSYTYTHMHL